MDRFEWEIDVLEVNSKLRNEVSEAPSSKVANYNLESQIEGEELDMEEIWGLCISSSQIIIQEAKIGNDTKVARASNENLKWQLWFI